MKKGADRRPPAVAAVKACHPPAEGAEAGRVAEGAEAGRVEEGAVVAVADLKTKSKGPKVKESKRKKGKKRSRNVERVEKSKSEKIEVEGSKSQRVER